MFEVDQDAAFMEWDPHPTPLRGATFSRAREKGEHDGCGMKKGRALPSPAGRENVARRSRVG